MNVTYMARRELTENERESARRLKQIWANKKSQLGLTQEKLGLMCGWSGQSAINQYLNGYTPLNMDAVLKLSKFLGVHPSEIMPEIAEWLPGSAETMNCEHKKIYEMLGRLTEEQKRNSIEALEAIDRQNTAVIDELYHRLRTGGHG